MQKQGESCLTEQLALLHQLFQAIQCISVSTGPQKTHSGRHGEDWERIWFEVI